MKEPTHFIVGCFLLTCIFFFIVSSHGISPPSTKNPVGYDDVTGIFNSSVGEGTETKSRVGGRNSPMAPVARRRGIRCERNRSRCHPPTQNATLL